VRFTGAVREYLQADDAVTDPRKYLAPARDAVAEAVAGLLDAIG